MSRDNGRGYFSGSEYEYYPKSGNGCKSFFMFLLAILILFIAAYVGLHFGMHVL